MNASLRPRILLIDDDPLFGRLLSAKGEQRTMDVLYYESLIDAVYGSDLRQFDVAVIDCMMPGMNGYELAEYLRTFHRELPVILVSHIKGRDSEERCRDVGATAFVAKHKGLNAILDCVQEMA